MGVTDADGNYTLNYIRDVQGAAVGRHSVRITAGDPVTGKPEPVPARYNVKTELRKEVKAGENEINFDLPSNERIVMECPASAVVPLPAE